MKFAADFACDREAERSGTRGGPEATQDACDELTAVATVGQHFVEPAGARGVSIRQGPDAGTSASATGGRTAASRAGAPRASERLGVAYAYDHDFIFGTARSSSGQSRASVTRSRFLQHDAMGRRASRGLMKRTEHCLVLSATRKPHVEARNGLPVALMQFDPSSGRRHNGNRFPPSSNTPHLPHHFFSMR